MRKYKQYDTEKAAKDAEKAISDRMGFPRVGVNALTRLPAPDKQQTLRWAEVLTTKTGKYVFVSDDDTGVDEKEEWFDRGVI